MSPTIAILILAASAAQPDLPTWKLADMPGLDGPAWSAPAKEASASAPADGGRSYRLAKAGRQAVIPVPVWWGQTFRPAEGTVYILRISYKDTASQPIIFYSHAGVAPHWGMSELHRFGGLADGKWKTADVPVSSDLICRKNVPGDITELAIHANSDLPVESIQVLQAEKDSAEKYFAETREWIARVQKDKREKALAALAESRPAANQVPDKLPAIESPEVGYAWPWLQPLPVDHRPDKADRDRPLKIRMARNEYEPAALAVYANGGNTLGVSIEVGPLTDAAGQKLECEVDLRTAEFSAVQAEVDYGRTADSGKYRLFPQRLWPAYPVSIANGRSQLYWITVHTLGEKSKPGLYKAAVKIKDWLDGKTRDAEPLELTVEVLPVTLLTCQQAKLELGNCTSGLPTLQEVKTLAEHNHTGMDLWFGGTYPQMSFEGTQLKLDWTYLDDWMAYAKKCGMTHMMWFLGGDPAGFPDTLNLERDLYRNQAPPAQRDARRREFLDKTNAAPDKIIPELRELYAEFIRQTARHAKEKDWPRLILQPFDEPAKYANTRPASNPFHKAVGSGPWIEGHFRDSCQIIRQAWPEASIGLEAHVVAPCLVFLKDVNVFCTNRSRTLPDLPERLKKAGVEFWEYANCDDQAPPYRTRYSFGFYFAARDSRGALVWAYNFANRFDTSGPGNWGSAWYTPFGTVMTPALVGLREGMDDRRWIETYKAQVVAKDPSRNTAALLDQIATEAIAQRADTRYDSYNEPTDPALLDQWRARIQDALVKAATTREK